MVFTERNLRSLVLMCRFLSEQNNLPRNFPLLPYVSADVDWTNITLFRKLILAEQNADEIAVQIGTTKADIQGSTAQFVTLFNANPTAIWSRLFGVIPGQGASAAHPHGVASAAVVPCFRGMLAHSMNGAHPCPGPLFDWHPLRARSMGLVVVSVRHSAERRCFHHAAALLPGASPDTTNRVLLRRGF